MQVKRHGNGALELEALLRNKDKPFRAPDVNDEAAWSRWGKYTPDHGILKTRMAVTSSPPEIRLQNFTEMPTGSFLSSFLSQGACGGALRLGRTTYEAETDNRVCVADGGDWVISGDQSSEVSGRLRFPVWGKSAGRVSGVRFRFDARDQTILDDLREAAVVEPCLRIEGKAWSFGWCDVRVSGGQAVRTACSAEVMMMGCCLGGLGPLGERAYEGVVAMNISRTTLVKCTLEACFFGGGRVRHNASLRLERSVVRLCGYGLACRDQGILHVQGCHLSNFTYDGAFMTFSHFTRTTRVNLLGNSVCGMPWVGGVKPRRIFERGTKYVGWQPKPLLGAAARKAIKRAGSMNEEIPKMAKKLLPTSITSAHTRNLGQLDEGNIKDCHHSGLPERITQGESGASGGGEIFGRDFEAMKEKAVMG